MRRAGVNVPLFSCRSSTSWGIGELGDVEPLARWLATAGLSEWMMLPIGTMPDGEASPYAATSTLAIDPLYLSLDTVGDFQRAGGRAALSEAAREAIVAAQAAPVVDHAAVRRAKSEALALAFGAFLAEEWEQLTTRAAALAAYVARERWWLDDYALYQALSRSMSGQSWRDWPAPLRDRDPRALDEARRQLARAVLEQQYAQWTAECQWHEARRSAHAHGVTLVGDLPFVPRHDSPEVWSRAGEFRLDLSAGVPPDAFSKAGQDWGLPTYRWDVVAASGFAWMRRRAERMAALFDGLRVDHVIGLYRTYARPRSGAAYFIPSDEAAQRAQGEAVLAILKERGIDIVVEDLGLIPEFVRSSLRAMGIPGCRVIRWERHWQAKGQPYIDPEGYPAVSAAMTGTHDTEPMAVWWDDLGADDREAFLALPVFARHDIAGPGQPWSDALRDAILELACRAGSDRLFLPIQDLFGWRARINTPGTVTAGNWTWCVPWPVDRMDAIEIARGRARFLRELCASSGRIGRPDYTRSARPGAGA